VHYGPNIPLMLNLTRKQPAKSWSLTRPRRSIRPVIYEGLEVMSSGFLVAEDQAISWDGTLIEMLIWQLIHSVDWSDLDLMIVDLPPGTADLQQSVTRLLPLSGAVIIVTPQDVAHLDAKKAINMFSSVGVPILGGIENMATMSCPHCKGAVDVFHPVSSKRSIWSAGVSKLGQIPLDPKQSAATDSGHPMMMAMPESPQAKAIMAIAEHLKLRLDPIGD
ncbi:MAG: Mrp/NBP35 family ATP-binding protein, partial [Actinobacteria bacterium]|nr:Mrp/NBP35 family ATP-binding protein [Actinomycetota bacterium]